MSLVNFANAEQERSCLLTLDRLTALRRSARHLSDKMRREIENMWLTAHITEFFTSSDLRLVEAAEEIINHGLRVSAQQAAGSRYCMS